MSDSGVGTTESGNLVVWKDGVRSIANESGYGVFGENWEHRIEQLLYRPHDSRGLTYGPGELIWWND